MSDITTLLAGKTVAIPETRQLDVLADMLKKRGADLIRCPLISILDTPRTEPVEKWLGEIIEEPFDDFIILTGEGFRRLLGFADRGGRKDAFIKAVSQVRKLTRGPKPGRALKEVDLSSDLLADAPTTEGVIATLDKEDISGRRIGVQLYGEDPNERLIQYLTGRGAKVYIVAPYIYAPKSSEDQVVSLIDKMVSGSVSVMTFTAQSQYKRLVSVAKKYDREEVLHHALNSTVIAAIGPVMKQTLLDAGISVEITPDTSFFMKPMVRKMIEVLN